MKHLAALLALLYTSNATPEQITLEWWQVLGEPCSTATDRTEGTCELEVKRKPTWQ